MTPTPGWRNFDNSPSVRLAKHPLLFRLLSGVGLVGASQKKFIAFVRENEINFADATNRLPLGADCVQVLYSCHMLEHLVPTKAERFLQEAFRVLKPGGILRIAVPDLRILVDEYLASGNADQFVEKLNMVNDKPNSFRKRLFYLIVGERRHQWQYDAQSLCALIEAQGFVEAKALAAGETAIPNPGPLNLHERSHESLYVEAKKPAR
ncbi:class I SAM-dependent methyltransferase [Acanthopleuribacter pedis]|uniref:Methyltransferase domain-containing protein n=1 Tax=Acanthopleuribacter pedis TaxID=442870 RepID=A0A8J7QJ95_9BACT|nr:methyltransferase domain-containing protein [Acanthopleuribacter pedis]MBO1321836.1 methyltransferase domain-containing protein [Acanthopleuribacter pedis]